MKNMADGFQSMSNRQAVNLVGKFVIGKDFTSGESVSGVAQALFFDANGQAFLKVGGRAVTVKDIEMIGDPSMIRPEFGGTGTQPGKGTVSPGAQNQAPGQPAANVPSQMQMPAQTGPKPSQTLQPVLQSANPLPAKQTEQKPADKKVETPPVSLRGGYGEWVLPNLEFVG